MFPPTECRGNERDDKKKRQRYCGQNVNAAEKTPSHSSSQVPSLLALTHSMTHTQNYIFLMNIMKLLSMVCNLYNPIHLLVCTAFISCVTLIVVQNKTDISKILTDYNCDLHVFPLTGVKNISNKIFLNVILWKIIHVKSRLSTGCYTFLFDYL